MPFVQARRAVQEKYLGELAERFQMPVLQIPLLPREVRGLAMLAELGSSTLPEANGHGDCSRRRDHVLAEETSQ